MFKRTLLIRLAIKDIHHLEKLNNCLEGNVPIKTLWQDSFGVQKEACHIEFNSAIMVKDLIDKGVTYNKTLTLEYPNFIKKHKYEWDFIRGYFDGDGSLHYQTIEGKKKSRRDYTVSFTSTESFSKSIRKKLV